MIRKSISVVLLFLLCACVNTQPAKLTVEKISYENEHLKVDADVPYINNFRPKEQAELFNTQLSEQVRTKLADFEQVAEKYGSLSSGLYEFHLTSTMPYSKDDIFSLLMDYSMYSGGAHNLEQREAVTYDMQQCKRLALADLFEPGTDYRTILQNKMKEMTENDPEQYLLWDAPMLTDKEEYSYYLSGDDIVIFYPPYTLSYYARGFVEFAINRAEVGVVLPDTVPNR